MQKCYHFLPKQCEELICKNDIIFCQKNVRNFFSEKVPHNFLAKNTTGTDYVSTVRLNKLATNNFVKLTML